MRRSDYGGQAVIEGVMMRGRQHIAVAVRDPRGRIAIHTQALATGRLRQRLTRIPLVRGVIALADTLHLSVRALLISAAMASGETPRARDQAAMTWRVRRSLIMSTLFGIGLFFLLPLALVAPLDPFLPSDLISNLVEGGIRLGLLVGYLVAIGRIPEVQRLFGLHGAEHQVVHAYEAGAALTPASVRAFPLVHPRCGTGFLLVLIVLSVVVFAVLGRPPLPVRAATRVLLLPLIAALTYEYVRLTAHYYHLALVRLLTAPSLALQRLSTRQPDTAMHEVACAALEQVLACERQHARTIAAVSRREQPRSPITLAARDG